MKFALTVESSIGIADKTWLIHDLSNKLSEWFSDKNYGNDVEKILVGVICVSQEFEWFSKIRKPRYKAYQNQNKTNVDNIEEAVFTFDIKIDYQNFKSQTNEQNTKMLALEIIKSSTNLDRLPKKIKDFDKNRFKEDMKLYFT